jgi:transposase
VRPLTWTGGEPVARQRARRVRRRGPEKQTIAKARHRAPARPYYDFPVCRQVLRRRGIIPRIARRGVESPTRLGRHRWKVERALSWLLANRRLTVRYERHADILNAFLYLACALICARKLRLL